MNAIRAGLRARQLDPQTELAGRPREESASREGSPRAQGPAMPQSAAAQPKIETTVDRFRQSMIIDYEKWQDGIGYDLALLKTATPKELVEIENVLLDRGVDDWRDVEALAALDSPRARVALKTALKSADHDVRTAVVDYAPHLLTDGERVSALVKALEGAEIYGGLTQALLQVEEYHPPPIIDALFRGALRRSGETAVHFAAMLMFLHGKATSPFEWEQRPFFLRFNTDDRRERAGVFQELCEKTGVDPQEYLRRESDPLHPDDGRR
jgi:hypothetical protein